MGRYLIWRALQYFAFATLAVSVCFVGSRLWLSDREWELTVNLVEESPKRFPEACKMHRVNLEWDRVRIYYGLFRESPNNALLFPYSNRWSGGGCCLDLSAPRYALVLYCKKCREAESAYRYRAAR